MLQANDGVNFTNMMTDKDGGADYGVKITIPQADLNRLATVDWTQYDAKKATDAVFNGNLPHRFATAESFVPEQFRFTGTIDVTCEIRANSLDAI